MQALREAIRTSHGIDATRCERIERGHTNETFLVASEQGSWVLRRSREARPERAIRDEAMVLEALQPTPVGALAPRVAPSRSGRRELRVDGRVVHLFERLPGAPLAPDERPTSAHVCAAMRALAALHRALAGVSEGRCGDPVELLAARRERVAAGPMERWPPRIVDTAQPALAAISAALEEGRGLLAGRATQWLHGDYHLGNLLYSGESLTGIVDFDDVGRGAPALEAALALFALARDAREERRLACDAGLFQAGLAAYREAGGEAGPWTEPTPAAARLFCAHQVLIHLEAGQHGLWDITPGIGFWGCWNSLMALPR